MGLTENPTNLPQKQAFKRCRVGGRVRRHPRTRRCLLKGCEKCYRPRQASQRYCGAECQEAARAWSRWKAQERYRGTEGGREKRRGQCQRYRERVRARRAQRGEAPETAARVIPANFFWPPAIDRDVTRDSREAGDRPCNGSARGSAGGRWSESGSGNGDGGRRGRNPHGTRFGSGAGAGPPGPVRKGDEEMVLKY